MAFGLVKDVKPVLSPLAAQLLGSVKTYIISYAENKILEYLTLLQNACPPPATLTKIANVLSKIKKLIQGFEKKIAFVSKLAKILLPAIAAAKIVVRILSKIPIPAAWAPVGVITSLSNLLVFLRKLIDIFEDDIKVVLKLLSRLGGIFDPTIAKLNAIQAVIQRCAETPDIYGGSGYTWGRLGTGSVEALSCVELNTSGNFSLFPRGVIVVDDKRNIISCYNTGTFTTGSQTSDTRVLIDRTGGLDTTGLGGGGNGFGPAGTGGSNALIGGVGTGNGTPVNVSGTPTSGNDTTGTGVTTDTGGTGISTNGTGVTTGTGGLNANSGFGIGGQGGTTTAPGTFIPNNQSNTGGSNIVSNSRTGNGSDGISNKGTLIGGTGTGDSISGRPPSSTNPGTLPTGTGVFIDGEEVGFTPEGRLALLNSFNNNTRTALITDLEYQGRNREKYFLSILEDETQDFVAPRRYAVAKDRRGIIVLQGPKSFASDQQVLIEEIKYRIDNQLP